MTNVLWQSLHGHFFQMTSPVLGTLQSRMAVHTDFLLLAYLPFYGLLPDPRTLMILQIIGVAAGAWPLWRLSRSLGSGWSSALVGMYLVMPGLLWSTIFDIHAEVLVIPLVLWAVWAAQEKRAALLWVTLIAIMLTKEEMGIVVALIALVLHLRKLLSRRATLFIILLGITWSSLMVGLVIPRAAPDEHHFAIGYFSDYGSTIKEVLHSILLHPLAVVMNMIRHGAIGYLTILLGAVGWLALRRPLWLLPASVAFGLNLMSNENTLHSIYYHYTSAITPFIFLAAIEGVHALRQDRWLDPRWLRIWTWGWVTIMVWLWSPLPGTHHHHDVTRVFASNPYRQTVQQLVQDIPPAVPLAVSNDLGPHFSARPAVWVFPFALDQAQAAIVLLHRPFDVVSQAELQEQVQRLQADTSNWQLVLHQQDLYYFRRLVP